jgi:hypothetical protein
MATEIGEVHGDSHDIAVFVCVFFGLAAIVLPLLIQLRRSRGDHG